MDEGHRIIAVSNPSEAIVIARLLWRRRLVAIMGLASAMLVCSAYLRTATRQYTSTACIYVEQTGPRIMHEVQQGIMTESYNYLHTQAQLIRSLPVISRAIEICGKGPMHILAGPQDHNELILERLKVIVGRKDDIIRISFSSPYPEENARIVNAIVQAYIEFHAASKRQISTEVLRILQERKTQADRILAEQTKDLIELQQQEPRVLLQPDPGLGELERLSTALTEAQIAVLQNRSCLQAAQNMSDDPDGLLALVESRFGPGQVSSWRSDLAGLRARYRQLLTWRDEHLRLVTAEHPTVKVIEQQIADTRQQIEQLQDRCVGVCLAMLRQQSLDAEQRQEQLSASLERKQQQIRDLNKTMVQYAILRSEYEQTKRLSETLAERIREVDMAEDAGAMNIKVLDLARPALRPSRPQTLKVIAIASLLGVVIGVIGAIWREGTDDRIHDLGQIKTLSCGPILGMLPAVSRRKGRAIRSSVFTSRAPAAFTEALAFLSARLYATGKDGQHKIIQIASALPAEGVSTVTGQLGMAMARHGLNVLIVDANWSYPPANPLIGQGTGADGLLAVLAGKARLSRAIRGVGIPRLSLLPAGSWPDGQPVVSVRLLEMVLTRLALHYDQILIDSPPVTACADAQLVAGCCKAWMLVVRPGRCTARALHYAQEVLGLPGRHCIGIVVNRVRLGRRYRFESPAGYIRKRMATGGNGPTRPDHAYQLDRPASRLAQVIGQQ